MDLMVDDKRLNASIETIMFVRAKYEGKWGSYDIATLDKKSLVAWLRSRGGENEWAENVVGVLLGHGALHEHGKS